MSLFAQYMGSSAFEDSQVPQHISDFFGNVLCSSLPMPHTFPRHLRFFE